MQLLAFRFCTPSITFSMMRTHSPSSFYLVEDLFRRPKLACLLAMSKKDHIKTFQHRARFFCSSAVVFVNKFLKNSSLNILLQYKNGNRIWGVPGALFTTFSCLLSDSSIQSLVGHRVQWIKYFIVTCCMIHYWPISELFQLLFI